jgi:hypothetical protein
MFDSARAKGLEVSAAVRVGQDHFLAEIAEGKLHAERGEPAAPDFAFEAPVASPIAWAVYGKLPFDELAPAGLRVTGDREAALRYVDCFHLPEKIY